MTPRQFTKALKDVGLSQRSSAKFFGVNERTVRRWIKSGEFPLAVSTLLLLMVTGNLTVADVER